MPRTARIIPPLTYLHLMIRGNNKRGIFRKPFEYNYFKRLLFIYKRRFGFPLFHYVLMRNHIHLAIQAGMNSNISKMMQGLQLAYGHYHRRRHDYVGHLWQGRFKHKIIKDDTYLLTNGLYVERNPVKSRIVNDPADYSWSSYRYYAFGEKNLLLDPNPTYLGLAKTAAERQRIYQELMAISIDQIEKETCPQ